MVPAVREVMSTMIHTVSPSTTVGEAVALMAQHRIGSTVVMDGNRLEGIFTERDTVRAISQSHDAPAHEVSSWMTPDPMTVGPDEDVEIALTVSRSVKMPARRLPSITTVEPMRC